MDVNKILQRTIVGVNNFYLAVRENEIQTAKEISHLRVQTYFLSVIKYQIELSTLTNTRYYRTEEGPSEITHNLSHVQGISTILPFSIVLTPHSLNQLDNI